MLNNIGAEWLHFEVDNLTDKIIPVDIVGFNEENRFLPESVTSMPGYIRYDVNPYAREIISCADVNSPVRECYLKKGVQITYSTMLESIAMYYMAHVKTVPMMYVTADKDLAKARVENNFLPMLQQSGFADIIRSSDEGNSRKTGKTAEHLQWLGGGYMVPFGAINANKMRSFSIMVMLKDEIDGWPDEVGRDGDPDKLTDARCKGWWERRKIFKGSTPLLLHNSKIEKNFKKGDQRVYLVECRKCGFPQHLRWQGENKATGKNFGFAWDLDEWGRLIHESVRYHCQNCAHPHYEHDKDIMFSEEHGAHWKPTARPIAPDIRSYHLPGMYSPVGMFPWYGCVEDYLEAFDPETKKVIDNGKFQVFYNNVLAEPYEVRGSKISFVAVSAHRRLQYNYKTVPNRFAVEYCDSPILFLTCTVDVHKAFLAVKVTGWCKNSKNFLIDYWTHDSKDERFMDEDCTLIESPVWAALRELIEEQVYHADDGREYRISNGLTFVDAGYAMATVLAFCDDYAAGVYPTVGRERTPKASRIREFAEFETQTGTTGYTITTDHYKDRLAPVLRREWGTDSGPQKAYHFNAPIDCRDSELKELTTEKRVECKDSDNRTYYKWHRPGNARNEMWDLSVYEHCAVDVLCVSTCEGWGLESVDWPRFWEHREKMLDDL